MPIWFIIMLVAVAFEAVAFLIMPKPAAPKPSAVQDAQTPTSEAGIPQPVIFGTITVSGTNVLWWGDKSKKTYMVNA